MRFEVPQAQVFGVTLLRCIGLVRVGTTISTRNLVYNADRYTRLTGQRHPATPPTPPGRPERPNLKPTSSGLHALASIRKQIFAPSIEELEAAKYD